jgi:hypothetical protein
MMHRSFASLVALALVGLVFSVAAPAQGRRLTVSVPHAFTVGTETLPAGEYTIRRAGTADPRVFAVHCAETGRTAVVIATPDRSAGTAGATVLTFARYGEEYFLTSVASAGERCAYRFDSSERQQQALARAGVKAETSTLHASVAR